jgi:hypothetical protein
MSFGDELRTKPKLWLSAGLVAVGLAGGAILGATMSASASTGTTQPSNSNGSSSSSTSTPSSPDADPRGGDLTNSGTVTAVGSNSVTIDGKAYVVGSNSDIDKNGESSVSNLAVGDKVIFSTDTSTSTPTIDKLHTGNESLNRPAGRPGDNDSPTSSSNNTSA